MAILAAIDFSSVTTAVVEALPDLMNPNETLHLIHVGEPDPDFIGFDVGERVVRQQRENQFHHEHEQLTSIAEQLNRQGLKVVASQPHGSTAKVILEQATECDARMIVLGSHGHSALYDLIAGSVAESVIRKSDRPVLLVPPIKP